MIEEVTVEDMLSARDGRAARQNRLLAESHCPIIYLTMNIPGPIKVPGGVRAAFLQAAGEVDELLRMYDIPIKQSGRLIAKTGCEAWWQADAPAQMLKKAMCGIEDSGDIGRLLDLDVIDVDGRKLSRETMRRCLLCARPAAVCARSRAHSVAEMTAYIQQILVQQAAIERQADTISRLAEEALCEEVKLTPKPGLVDQRDNGAHTDMDLHLFRESAAAIAPYFGEMYLLGRIWTGDADALFAAIRPVGLRAEQAMWQATGGVNTHKGAIFVLGVLAGAAGWVMQGGEELSAKQVLRLSRRMCQSTLLAELAAKEGGEIPGTHGEQVYRCYGARGVRGEAADGFPSIEKVYRMLTGEEEYFVDRSQRLLYTLLQLMCTVEDTTVLHRTGRAGLTTMHRSAQHFLAQYDLRKPEAIAALEQMNRSFVEQNISPGGCADLLGGAIFLEKLEKAAVERD